MSIFRYQISDIHEQGIIANFNQFATVVDIANKKARAGHKVAIDMVGDFTDNKDRILEQVIEAEYMQAHPDIRRKEAELDHTIATLNAKYQGNLQKTLREGNVAPEDLETITANNEETQILLKTKREGLVAFRLDAIREYTSNIAATISKADPGVDLLATMGNHDYKGITDVILGEAGVRFTDLAPTSTTSHGMNVIGSSNTVESEFIPKDYRVGYDGGYDGPDKTYNKFSVEKVGKAQIIQLHGPPGNLGLRVRGGVDRPLPDDSMTRLIEEHASHDPDRPLIVECGHFHDAQAIKKNNVWYFKSCPGVIYEHEFSDDGKYIGSTVYRTNEQGALQKSLPTQVIDPHEAYEQAA